MLDKLVFFPLKIHFLCRNSLEFFLTVCEPNQKKNVGFEVIYTSLSLTDYINCSFDNAALEMCQNVGEELIGLLNIQFSAKSDIKEIFCYKLVENVDV